MAQNILISFSIILSFTFLSSALEGGYADNQNPGLYSSGSTPFGVPYVDWTTRWWQWYIGIPNSQTPFADTSGQNCGINQEGPVWNLLGSPGKVERTCTIQSDKAILFPILVTECSYSESPSLKTKEDLLRCAMDANKDAVLQATVDNQQIKDIDKYRVTSSLFNVTYPDDSIYPTNSNFSQAVSDGWFIMLEPMKPGQHQIRFTASQIGQVPVDTTYHLIIK